MAGFDTPQVGDLVKRKDASRSYGRPVVIRVDSIVSSQVRTGAWLVEGMNIDPASDPFPDTQYRWFADQVEVISRPLQESRFNTDAGQKVEINLPPEPQYVLVVSKDEFHKLAEIGLKNILKDLG